jgi:endoglycosylceramidase
MRRPALLVGSIALAWACSKAPATNGGGAADGGPPGAAVDAGPCTSPDFAGTPLGVHCNQLVDGQGRSVLLHGVNARVNGVFDVSFTDGRLPNEPIPVFTAEDAARIRALGFNALRLPIQWSAIEPTEDGGIDGAYLDTVASVTSLCNAAGLLVLLDFHQDAYSKEIGEDGEPLWAIAPPPTELLGGPMGGTLPDGGSSPDLGTRRNSAQVGAAFASFFDPDGGQTLRDRYTAMATQVAARFANDPAVFGFELFNEPLAGDDVEHALYAEMIPAMRAAAPTKLLLWEPDAIRNVFDTAPVGKGTPLGAGTVYSPHIYTDAFTGIETFTQGSLAKSNVNALSEAQSWGAPLVITEWGFGPTDPRFADYVGFEEDAQEEVLASSFFWVWKEISQGNWGFFDDSDGGLTERAAMEQALTRPHVEATAGALLSIAYDATVPSLSVKFLGTSAVAAPNVVSIGAAAAVSAAQWTATCDGVKAATGGADPLQIACSGPGMHSLVVSAR